MCIRDSYWSIWALTKDRKHLVNITVAASNIEIASGGRWVAAMKLRDARKQLKMNQITRTIEYALLKADELTSAEIGTATGYAANEVQAGLKALVEAKLAHKAGKAWRWGVPRTEGSTPAPTTPATGTYRSEPVPAILARPRRTRCVPLA